MRLVFVYPWLKLVLIEMLVGGFLIERRFSLFRKMFEYAASMRDPLYGAQRFALQGLGNVLLTVRPHLLLTNSMGGRFGRWLAGEAERIRVFTATALLISGSFFITYWGPKAPGILRHWLVARCAVETTFVFERRRQCQRP